MTALTSRRPAAPASSGRASAPASWRWLVALVVSAGAGAFVFFWRLSTPSVISDEFIYRQAAAEYVRGSFETNLEHPPLAKLLIGVGHVLLGGTVFADRFVSALLGFLTGFLLAGAAYQLTRSARAAVAAGLLWWLLPLAPGVVQLHVARGTFLEGPMLFFLSASLLAATTAARSPRLRWIVAAAALGGLAASCKLTGAVAVVGLLPVLALLRHDLRRLAVATGAAGAAAVTGLLLPYAPFGSDGPSALAYAVTYQLDHAADGHLQIVAGRLYEYQPWWSPFWHQAQYLGWPALVALVVAAGIGVGRVRRPEVLPAVAVLAAAVLVVCTTPIKLPQYPAVLTPVLCLLAGAALVPGVRRGAGRALPVLLVVVFGVLAVAGARQLADVADEGIEDYRAAGIFLRERVDPGVPITVWGSSRALSVELPANPLPEPLPPDGRPVALVVDPTISDRRPNEDVPAWLAAHGDEYEVHRFQRVTVYLRR